MSISKNWMTSESILSALLVLLLQYKFFCACTEVIINCYELLCFENVELGGWIVPLVFLLQTKPTQL